MSFDVYGSLNGAVVPVAFAILKGKSPLGGVPESDKPVMRALDAAYSFRVAPVAKNAPVLLGVEFRGAVESLIRRTYKSRLSDSGVKEALKTLEENAPDAITAALQAGGVNLRGRLVDVAVQARQGAPTPAVGPVPAEDPAQKRRMNEVRLTAALAFYIATGMTPGDSKRLTPTDSDLRTAITTSALQDFVPTDDPMTVCVNNGLAQNAQEIVHVCRFEITPAMRERSSRVEQAMHSLASVDLLAPGGMETAFAKIAERTPTPAAAPAPAPVQAFAVRLVRSIVPTARPEEQIQTLVAAAFAERTPSRTNLLGVVREVATAVAPDETPLNRAFAALQRSIAKVPETDLQNPDVQARIFGIVTATRAQRELAPSRPAML